MIINNLEIRNFRNYVSQTFSFHPKLNIFFGKNGSGKTNILEAFLFVSNTHSFRTRNDADVIKNNEEYARINLKSEDNTYKVVINKDAKKLYLNEQLYRKSSEYIGKLNCLLFKPNDLFLFDGAPKERRNLIDEEISKVDYEYLDSLLVYRKLLSDKNAILKQDTINEDYLNLIEEMMAEKIRILINKRKEFVEIINKHISNHYQNISKTKDEIKIRYLCCCDNNDIKKEINKYKEKERIFGYCLFGPQKEDVEILFNNRDINSIASQGQKRTAMIAFKFSIYDYIYDKKKKRAVLLLDDILSELDQERKINLIENLPDAQVFITCTEKKENLLNYQEKKLFRIDGGKVYE